MKKGDNGALEEIYDLYSPVLLSISIRYTDCKEDAEDVMHDSFIKILKGLKKFTPQFEGSFEAWMKRITVNTSINFIKKKVKLSAYHDNIHEENIMPESTIGPDLPERLHPDKVIEFIRELPPGYRTVMNLYVFENYTHKEIAKELNISTNTSKSQLSKARMLLRKKVLQHTNTLQHFEDARI